MKGPPPAVKGPLPAMCRVEPPCVCRPRAPWPLRFRESRRPTPSLPRKKRQSTCSLGGRNKSARPGPHSACVKRSGRPLNHTCALWPLRRPPCTYGAAVPSPCPPPPSRVGHPSPAIVPFAPAKQHRKSPATPRSPPALRTPPPPHHSCLVARAIPRIWAALSLSPAFGRD
ncbi:MAG: hypothetical protein J3K34DRAFT_399474 [Monoraphidium minutum]|nr:MAG: hypothetical protein J3K34DRAFT_399474 [Monoraphidium minutum]